MSLLDKYLNNAFTKVTSKLDALAAKALEGDAPSSIDKFRATLTNTGLGRPNNFIVNFSLPNYVSTSISADIKSLFGVTSFDSDLGLLCNEASLPSRKLNTVEVKTSGFSRKVPNNYTYEDITFSFIDTNDHLAYNIFSNWMDGINNPYTNSGKFYDDYTSDIKVNLLDKENKTTKYISMIKAYPISIDSLPLSWESSEGYNKVKVTFNYLYHIDKDYSSAAIINTIKNFSVDTIKNNFKNIGDSARSIINKLTNF